jgi:PAS domain S-box-containing protein
MNSGDMDKFQKMKETLNRLENDSSDNPDVKTLIEELRSHQIEIEMQNDELNRSKDMLAKALRRYEELYQQLPVGYLTSDEYGQVIDVNATLLNMLQTDKASFTQTGLFPYFDAETSDIYTLHCREAVSSGKRVFKAMVLSERVPEKIYVELQSIYSAGAEEGKKEIRTVIIDVSAQKKAEAMSEETKTRIEGSMLAGNMAWWEMELPSGKVIFNENKSKMLGYEASQFKTYGDFMKLVHPDDYEPAMEAFRQHMRGEKERYECEYRIKSSSGDYLWFKDVGKIIERERDWIKLVGIVINITELKETQEKLIYQEKTAAVGQLTAGIAHEFNNALTGILGAAQMLEMHGQLSESQKKMVAMIVKTGGYAASLVKQMLDYSAKSIRRLKSIVLVTESFQLLNQLREKMAEDIKVSLKFSGMEDLAIKMDREQFRQIFQNIILNAKDAMPSGGEIVVTLSPVSHLPEKVCSACHSRFAGNYFVLSFQDNGAGMDANVKKRIFEPFFSTKEVGQGSGLGLSQVMGIVKQYEGHILVDTELNQGTKFCIYLPESMVEQD